MTDCHFCNFQILRVPDLKTKDGEFYYAVVLKSKKMNHDCSYLPKRIPENVHCSSNDLPTIHFLKADNVLRRRFYEICPPIQRKRLWNCSRTCANLGKKPTTLFVAAFTSVFFGFLLPESSSAIMDALHMIPSKNSIVSTRTNQILLDNFVMDFRFDFSFGLDSQRMAELTRFVEFNLTSIQFNNDHDLTNFHPLIFTPKVRSLLMLDIPGDSSSFWPLLPNLEFLTANASDFPMLLKQIVHFSKLSNIYLCVDEHLDYSMIAKFLRNQNSNLWLTLVCSLNLDLNEKSLRQHFMPVEKKMWNQKGLCFTFNVNEEFFVLR